MGPNNALFSSILSLFFLATLASASTFLSDNIFNKAGVSRGRALVEDEPLKVCSIDFEKQNYTVLTSQCKGPNYSPKICCEAFKQFACPFTEYINDMSTDCAPAMFYFINLHGHYPQGLFANNCREGPEGLDCTLVKPVKISHTSINHGKRNHTSIHRRERTHKKQ